MAKGFIGYVISFFIAFLASAESHARVVDITERKLAFFVRGIGGDSWTHQEAFAHEDSTTTVVGSSQYTFGGEVGVLYAFSPTFVLRFGGEVERPKSVLSGVGRNGNGEKLYTLDSQILTFIPQVTAEYVYKMLGSNRLLFLFGAGYAIVNLQNHYEMTTLGRYQLGLTDVLESGSGASTTFFVGTGWEANFVDQTTTMFEIGYRQLKISSMRNTRTGQTLVQPGGSNSGDAMVNEDGSARKLDLSSVFVGLSFRISIQ